jgi:hypothetical protein
MLSFLYTQKGRLCEPASAVLLPQLACAVTFASQNWHFVLKMRFETALSSPCAASGQFDSAALLI